MEINDLRGYSQIKGNYQFRDNGIDPQEKLFSAPRMNEIVNISSNSLTFLRDALCCLGCPFTLCFLLTRVKPMHDTVVTRCDVVSEILREPGPYCLNPCFMSTYEVYMGLTDIELNKLPINDLHGNPLIISAQFVYRIADSMRAQYTVQTLKQFLKDQGGSALRAVCGHYPFDDVEDGNQCLRKHSESIDNQLKITLQRLVDPVGVIIDSFRLSGISVEQHMEKLLLARQEAHAELIARKTIADGSAGIIQELIKNYMTLGIKFTQEELNRFAMDLTLILVNHGHTTLNLFEGNRGSMDPSIVKKITDQK